MRQGGITLNAPCRTTLPRRASTLTWALAQSGGQGVAGSIPVSPTEEKPQVRGRFRRFGRIVGTRLSVPRPYPRPYAFAEPPPAGGRGVARAAPKTSSAL